MEQINYWVPLLWKPQKWYYENLHEKSIMNDKHFFETNKTITSRWENTQKEPLELDNRKVLLSFDTPTKIIKENADIFAEYFFCSINGSTKPSSFPSFPSFPSCLKIADITPIQKDVKEN